jgi:drug/metabolite transporter (DMT)-like permease
MGFLLRWLFALGLVTVTYNPTPFNFTRWAMTDGQDQLSLTVLAGLVLLVGYIIYLRATLRSIGPLGMMLILGIVGALLWVAYDFGLLNLQNRDLTTWIGILALSLVLGIGLSWSIIRRKLSGQADMDDVDE